MAYWVQANLNPVCVIFHENINMYLHKRIQKWHKEAHRLPVLDQSQSPSQRPKLTNTGEKS